MPSEPQVPLSIAYTPEILDCPFPPLFIGNVQNLLINQPLPYFLQFIISIVAQVFLKCKKCVWVTAILYLAGFCQRHETVAGSSLPCSKRCNSSGYIRLLPGFNNVQGLPVVRKEKTAALPAIHLLQI